jgi:hypothetical protein
MRTRKPSGRPYRGPFTAANFEAAIRLDGWTPEPHQTGGGHVDFCHPTRKGKIQIDYKWTAVKPGHDPFKGVMEQGGYSKRELLELLNRAR